jgi:hypothetical protein
MIDDLFPQEVPNHEVAETAKQFRKAANLLHEDELVAHVVTPLMCNSALA